MQECNHARASEILIQCQGRKLTSRWQANFEYGVMETVEASLISVGLNPKFQALQLFEGGED